MEQEASDSSNEQGPSQTNKPVRPAPPISKIQIPHRLEDEDPPPYTSSVHAVSSGLLNSSSNTGNVKIPRNPNNRNSQIPAGYRQYTQYLTKRNLLIAAGIIILLIVGGSILSWMISSEDEYYVPTPNTPTHRIQVKELEPKFELLGPFTEHECKNPTLNGKTISCYYRQRLSFDELTDEIVLSKYLPREHLLTSETLEVDKGHKKYISHTKSLSQDYEDCMRLARDVSCCSTSPHGHEHRTDCYLNIDGQEIKSVASHYDFMHNWQSLRDGNKFLFVFNKQGHAILNLKTKRIHKIEENSLPRSYISIAFFFPQDNSDKLHELVRSNDEFRVCEYKQKIDEDYALQNPDCKITPFHVEFELPKVRFCSIPIYTAVVQYGHLADESDLTFRLKIVFDGYPNVYTSTDSLKSNYDQLVIDCNDEHILIYAMGSYEIARFSVKLPNSGRYRL